MTAIVLSLVALLLGPAESPVPSQGDTLRANAVPEPDRESLHGYLFHDAEAVFWNGTRTLGLFAGLSHDSVLLWQPGVTRSIGFDQLRSLRLHRDASPSTGALYGMLIGAYAFHVLGQRGSNGGIDVDASKNYLYYQLGSTSPWLYAFAGAFVGGMLGYLGSSSSGGVEDLFDFSGAEDARRHEIDRLSGNRSPGEGSRFHISLSAGSVSFGRGAAGQGFAFASAEEDTRWTVLRRVTATYSVLPWVDAGIGFADFSEPDLTFYGYSGTTSWYGDQYAGNRLLFLAGVLRPLEGRLPQWVSWEIGAGAGVAAIDYSFSVTESNYQSDIMNVISDNLHSTRLGVTVFTGLSLSATEHLSVGIVADYTGAPAVHIAAHPEVGMQERTLGNTCVGVELGVHF